ncbi:MAG TPA: biopolymer transporter ExbD [Epsilonproteobacteria bacterium]|nr:biopolymer transporter ExbD [Campylobacterota bacterium]
MFNWDENPDLNITPLVDVMLVLMAVLMVTAPTITYQEKIKLPDGSKTVQVEKPKSLTVRIDKNLQIYFQNDSYTFSAFGDDFVHQAKSLDLKSDIYIRADKDLPYGDVMKLLSMIKSAGFQNVSLVTQ